MREIRQSLERFHSVLALCSGHFRDDLLPAKMAVKGKYSYAEYHILENFNQRFAITVLDIIDLSSMSKITIYYYYCYHHHYYQFILFFFSEHLCTLIFAKAKTLFLLHMSGIFFFLVSEHFIAKKSYGTKFFSVNAERITQSYL